jgi:hypothetical protein
MGSQGSLIGHSLASSDGPIFKGLLPNSVCRGPPALRRWRSSNCDAVSRVTIKSSATGRGFNSGEASSPVSGSSHDGLGRSSRLTGYQSILRAAGDFRASAPSSAVPVGLTNINGSEIAAQFENSDDHRHL